MKYGILGGTFDPPHNGHLHIAQIALRELNLDEVVLVPAGWNPLKLVRPVASGPQRWEMCQAAIEGEPQLSVSDIELTQGGRTYAYETIREFKRARPGDYIFILGADTLRTLPEWYQIDKLAGLCRFAAFDRDTLRVNDILGQLPGHISERVLSISAPLVHVSSSKIREALARKESIVNWVPTGVADYIERSKLYHPETH
ncbi:MAG: nicotinate-nucleotide adenylyltransferase [Fimbriimonadaceae bacterium]